MVTLKFVHEGEYVAEVKARLPVLEIENLTVSYRQGDEWLDAVRNVDLRIAPGQSYGLVGESGSGKTTLALAIMRYLPENGVIRSGTIRLAGQDLVELSTTALRHVWREKVRLVPQNPLSSLNPSLRIGEQLVETLPQPLSRGAARARAVALLETVRIADPERVAHSYPHQISGGMQQRVMIAMALSGEPALLVLDEPTTNLDTTTEAAILDLFKELIEEYDTAVLYVSHNLGVVAQVCDRVAVLYAGELVEDAEVTEVYHHPLHPYTRGLLDSVPCIGENKREVRLRPIPGQIPELEALPRACVFTPRCPLAIDVCSAERPPAEMPTPDRSVRCHRWREIRDGRVNARQPIPEIATIQENGHTRESVLRVNNLKKWFEVNRSIAALITGEPERQVRAVDGIDLEIPRSQTVGLVGESGSGKTTLARCIIGLTERSGGEVELLDMPLPPGVMERDAKVLRQLQIVFQNPEGALNPYMTVRETLRRPLIHLAGYSPTEADEHVVRLLQAVRLSPTYADRMPSQLSGGEKQRVAIARAFASNPEAILFDESVSGLDVSVQASILNLLNELQAQNESAYLFISHDLSVVGYLSDAIAVIYLGHLMEVGKTENIFAPPYHPYTEALLSAIPLADPTAEQKQIRLEGEIPSPIDVPSGCPFHTRCPRFLGDVCIDETPPWREAGDGHRMYCHIPIEELKAQQTHVFRFAKEAIRDS